MKNKIFTIITAIAFVVIFCICNYYEHNYTRDAEVVSVHGSEVIALDTCGYEWEFYTDSENELSKGEQITLKMWDHCSAFNVLDDEVTGYKTK